jgi:hypothetical protein
MAQRAPREGPTRPRTKLRRRNYKTAASYLIFNGACVSAGLAVGAHRALLAFVFGVTAGVALGFATRNPNRARERDKVDRLLDVLLDLDGQ